MFFVTWDSIFAITFARISDLATENNRAMEKFSFLLSFANTFSHNVTESVHIHAACACVQGHGRTQNSIFSLICQAVTAKRNSRSLFRAARHTTAALANQADSFVSLFTTTRESPGGWERITKSTRIDGFTSTITTSRATGGLEIFQWTLTIYEDLSSRNFLSNN